jgi:alkylhydroperoxidase family enzyme
MRLNPIDKPMGIAMRFAFWLTRRKFGKVLTPMRVLYPRMPRGMKLAYEIQKFETSGLHLDPALHFLVASLVSEINGCSFCVDISRAMAIRKHMGLEKFNELADYRTSPLYSDRERAALRYVEEATRHEQVSDATFASLREHFSENEIVELTWLNAVHNYYNLINVPLEIESDGLCAIAQEQMAVA